MRYLLKTALIGLLIISPALAKKKPPSPVITPQTVTLNANTATYSNPGSFYSVRENPSGRGSLVRGTGFQELLTLTPSTMPAGTVMNWSWPTSQGTPYSYPEIAYGNLHPGNLSPPATKANAFTTLTEQISYTEGGPALTYNMLTEMWLSLDAGWSANAFEVELQLNDIQKETRPFAIPINHHMTSPFNADVYVGLTPQTDGSYPILIYPQTAFTNQIETAVQTFSGSSAPSTDPTHCDFATGLPSGITRTIIGSGTTTAANGTTVNYVDVQYSGTPGSSGILSMIIDGDYWGGYIGPFGAYPTTWLGTMYVAVLSAGTGRTNVGVIQLTLAGYDDNTSTQQESVSGGNIAATLTTTPQQYSMSYTPGSWANGNTHAAVVMSLFAAVTSGSPVNITFRIASPAQGYDPTVALNNTTINWKAIYADLIAAGDITGNEYAHGFEIGPEVYNGVGSLTINSFNVTWN